LMQSTVLALLIKHIEPTDFPQFVTPQCLPTALSCTCIPPNVDTSKFQVLVHLNMHLTTLVLSSLAQPLPSCPGHCCAHSWHHQPQTTTGVGPHTKRLLSPAGITHVSPWEVVLLSPMLFGRRSQGLSQQPSIAGSSQATALEGAQEPQGYLQQHHVSGQLQGMAHRTALHQMAAPGVVSQGIMGPPGAGPSQASARAVAGAHAHDRLKEPGNFTTNARSVPSARLCLCTQPKV